MSINRRTILAAPVALAAGTMPAVADTASELSSEARRILELEAPYETAVIAYASAHDHTPEHAALHIPVKEIEAEFEALRRTIWSRPVRSFADVIDRALVARWASIDVNVDGSWSDFELNDYEKAHAETLLGILQLAGVTDGKVERHGRAITEPAQDLLPRTFTLIIRDDRNAPVLVAGMKVEFDTTVEPQHGDIVFCRPGPNCPDLMTGIFEVEGSTRRVRAITDTTGQDAMQLGPHHRPTAVALWEVRDVGDLVVRGRLPRGA